MALNAYVTPDGGEIGRAQAVQAEAALVFPSVDMNPILLKPEGDSRSQVVVLGKSIGRLSAVEYHAKKPELRALVHETLDRLRARHDVVVIEGAGSPAEINLKDRDLVNMFVAGIADAPVVLVGDIDRGGVFAALVGTMELLEPHERARVGAFLINKFRGDIQLLEPGLRFIEQRTGVPVLGVLPYVQRLRIADESSVSLEERRGRRRARPDEVEIAVVRLPRIANYDDFQPLEHEPGVVVRFIEHADGIEGADLVILPGTKSTVADLRWLRTNGIADGMVARAKRGQAILGICGGCQMLGHAIGDPDAVESEERTAEGLKLLAVVTQFGHEKRTSQVRARGAGRSLLSDGGGEQLEGYEIHMGRLERLPGASGAFVIAARNGHLVDDLDGAVSQDGAIVGTMVHGLFENAAVRRSLIAGLRRNKGLPDVAPRADVDPLTDEYDRLADVIRQNVNMDCCTGSWADDGRSDSPRGGLMTALLALLLGLIQGLRHAFEPDHVVAPASRADGGGANKDDSDADGVRPTSPEAGHGPQVAPAGADGGPAALGCVDALRACLATMARSLLRPGRPRMSRRFARRWLALTV